METWGERGDGWPRVLGITVGTERRGTEHELSFFSFASFRLPGTLRIEHDDAKEGWKDGEAGNKVV